MATGGELLFALCQDTGNDALFAPTENLRTAALMQCDYITCFLGKVGIPSNMCHILANV